MTRAALRGYGSTMLGSGLIGGSLAMAKVMAGDVGRSLDVLGLAQRARAERLARRPRPRVHPRRAARDPRLERRLLPRRGPRARGDPGRRPGAARRQPLRRHADRRHVRLLPALLRPLRRRPALPPARPRPRLPGARRAREPQPLRHGPGQPGQHARRAGPRRRAARVPGRRPRDLPAELGAGPDRLRGAHGLRQARARARHPDRARGGDRRPGDRAVPRPGRALLARAAARQGAAAEGVPGPGGAAVRPHAARPAAALPAPGEDQGPGAPADRPAAPSWARRRTPRTPTSSSPGACRTRCPSSRTSARCPIVG